MSVEDLAAKTGNARARLLSRALNAANGRYLENNKAPSRKVGEPDNRDSHYWLTRYWAQELAANSDDPELAERFSEAADALRDNEQTIIAELAAAQGAPVDIGGYYQPDTELASKAMRPSTTLNGIIDAI